MLIKTKDSTAQSLFTRLSELLVAAGSEFHPSLRLVVDGSEISYEIKGRLREDDQLVWLHPNCMPSLRDFRWSLDSAQRLLWQLEGGAIGAGSNNSGAGLHSALHQEIVSLLVEIYNHFDKVASYAQQSPAVQLLPYPELYVQLMRSAYEHEFVKLKDASQAAVMVEAFWQGRIFSSINTGDVVLIPLLEFFNHHLFARRFMWQEALIDGRALRLGYKSVGAAKNRDVYASYEVMDALHSFVKYGFVDKSAFFIQSQTFVIELADGIDLAVGYESVTSNQYEIIDWSPSPRYDASAIYRSRIRMVEGKYLLSYMLIPPKKQVPAFDEALMAQLVQIERAEKLAYGALANAEVVRRVKIKLLQENLNCYRSLKDATLNSKFSGAEAVSRSLKSMLQHQFAILREFKKTLDAAV